MKDLDLIEIVREFSAPPERVFDAWMVRANWAAWIGPEGITCTVEDMDPTIGGSYLLRMQLPDGVEMLVTGKYLLLDRPNRIEFSWGNAKTGTQSQVTLTFRAVPRGTEMVLQHAGPLTPADQLSVKNGWQSALNKLERFVEEK